MHVKHVSVSQCEHHLTFTDLKVCVKVQTGWNTQCKNRFPSYCQRLGLSLSAAETRTCWTQHEHVLPPAGKTANCRWTVLTSSNITEGEAALTSPAGFCKPPPLCSTRTCVRTSHITFVTINQSVKSLFRFYLLFTWRMQRKKSGFTTTTTGEVIKERTTLCKTNDHKHDTKG